MTDKEVQVRGKRDAGKSSAKVAQVVTVTVSPLKGATSRCSNNDIIQERGGAEAGTKWNGGPGRCNGDPGDEGRAGRVGIQPGQSR